MLLDLFRSRKLQKLPWKTDIHCHVVPGVDDGSPSAEKSVELLSHMADWGLERIFASPHSTLDVFENTPQTIAGPFAALKAAAAEAGLSLELEHHFEYRIDEFFLRQVEAGNLKPLPGNRLLIENPFFNEPWGLDGVVYELQSKGYDLILAHPERYRYYSESHRNRYFELHERGVRLQINLLSLAGHYGKTEREVAQWMLREGLVDFIGTDLHRMSHVESIERYLRSSQFTRDLKHLDKLQNDSI